MVDAVLENARLAAGCGADAAMVVAVAAASTGADTVDEVVRILSGRADELAGALRDHGRAAPREPAPLEPELRFEPELARVRPDLRDHELRGKLVFRDLVGKRSFFQVAAWAIAGVDLAGSDALLLEQLGVNTQLADARIWPLAIARRIAARGAPLAHALVGAVAAMCTPRITAEPVGAFMRFLDRVERERAAGRTVAAVVGDVLASGATIPGVGRPVLGPDERVPQVEALVLRHGRDGGASWRLAREVDAALGAAKGLRVNSAGYQGAILRDMGFSPRAATAFCVLYFMVPVLAQAAFEPEPRPA